MHKEATIAVRALKVVYYSYRGGHRQSTVEGNEDRAPRLPAFICQRRCEESPLYEYTVT
jgi:hypothetical protein